MKRTNDTGRVAPEVALGWKGSGYAYQSNNREGADTKHRLYPRSSHLIMALFLQLLSRETFSKRITLFNVDFVNLQRGKVCDSNAKSQVLHTTKIYLYFLVPKSDYIPLVACVNAVAIELDGVPKCERCIALSDDSSNLIGWIEV